MTSFDGGLHTGDAGAPPLGVTDKVFGLTHRPTAFFQDRHDPG